MAQQQGFVDIYAQSERELWRRVNAYARKYARQYKVFGARLAVGATFSQYETRRRFAFAILSANAPWQSSVNALRFAERYAFDIPPEAMEEFRDMQMVPAKAEYLRALPEGESIRTLLRDSAEPWEEYRERLVRTVRGLGRCKASFACLLLYPTESPLACLDTWMTRVYLGAARFVALSRKDYVAIERRVQRFGAKHGLNGALAQWVIWNAARGDDPTSVQASHDIFPGRHKDEDVVPF